MVNIVCMCVNVMCYDDVVKICVCTLCVVIIMCVCGSYSVCVVVIVCVW